MSKFKLRSTVVLIGILLGFSQSLLAQCPNTGIPPTAVCQNTTVFLDASGIGSITVADIDNGSTDDCGIVSSNLSQTTFTCADVGTVPVALTVQDGEGLNGVCVATVTVVDNITPTVLCQNVSVQLDATGVASVTTADMDAGSSDACGIASMSLDQSSFNCSNIGPNSVTLTVTDVNGNSETCTAIVTVEDTIMPTALCQDITVQLDASGNASISGASIDGGSNDNCGITLTAAPNAFTCVDIGVNTVTLTVTDEGGNVATCTANVTIEDNVPPTALCQSFTAQLDASGNATITVADIDGGSSDACGIASSSLNITSFTCADIGSNTVTLTVVDNNGNTSTCNATVLVEDNVDPTAVCQNITVGLDALGTASVTGADIDGGSSDACGILNLTATPNNFTCADVGPNSVTLTVLDNNANTSTCTATITIIDTISPTAICQDLTVQLDPSGNASITAAQVDGGSTDVCGIAGIAVSPSSFTCADVGSNTVTLTVTDVNGNTSNCTATVTVLDNVAPVALCNNLTVDLDATGNVSITAVDMDGGSSDACGIASLSISPSSFTCADIGSNAVTLTVTDFNGNTSSCVGNVIVQDNVSPIAVCQNITVQLDASGNASIVAADVDGGSSDACGIASLAIDNSNFTCTDIGSNTVTLTVTDVNGNISTCTSTVTVQDTIAPVAVCQDISIQLDATGNASIVAANVDGGSTDACGIALLSVTPSTFTCANVGANTVTLTVTDVNGNVSTCNASVTVIDSIAPIALCQDITVQLDASGNASIVAADIDGGSSDACGVTLSASQTNFTCGDVGVVPVTLLVTDDNGNTSTCTANVTVQDNIAPTAVCQDITAQLDASGNVTITAADVDGGSSDACGIASLTIDNSNFTCADLGSNTVTLTVTDVNGNMSTCTANVTVEDNVDPTAICQNITVQLDASGNATITAADVDGGSSDACGIASMAVGPDTFTCAEVGNNFVALTITDNNGNTSTCVATVTVVDSVSPIALCNDITVQLDASGNASITAGDIDGGSSDACGITLSASQTNFTCTDVGVVPVTLTVTDDNGNVSTCVSSVTVEDNVAPDVVCQDITVQLDATGNASIAVADIEVSSNDACGIASVVLDNSNFDCADVGPNTITLTATDVNGNISSCTAIVTVQDTVAPVAVCQDISVVLNGSGNASITAASIDAGSSDACGVTLTASQTNFTCADAGVVPVTLTVTDDNGNVSTCVANVTVQDTVAPTAVCQNITVQLDASGNASITAADIDGGSADPCGVTLSATPTNFTCANIGANSVTLTVTDDNGNISTCTATVTVLDTVPPAANCQDITVFLDATGNTTIVAADVDGGSNDACGIASLAIDNNSFTCANVGPNTVTLTVTDNNGNVSTCTSTVTVLDTVAPTAVCQDITITLNGSGNATITAASINGGSTDACGVTLSASQTSFTCADVGVVPVTLTVTDDNGNVATCVANVTVQDTVAPTAVCQNITVQLDASGNASITAADIDGGSSDPCGVTLVATPTNFTCANVGPNTVTLTVTDDNGNVSTCTATVTVMDTVPPVAVCQDLTVFLDATGNATIVAADVDGGSNDACGIASLAIDNNSFTCANVGPNTVTLTVTDNNGNASTCISTVTVQDTIAPTAICQNITVQLDASGNATISALDIDGGSSDACGLTLTASQTNFTCADIGSNTVTLTATDDNGNSSTCTANVLVEDNVNPTVICQDITVQLDASGNATILASDVDGGSNDACGIAGTLVNPSTFDCSNIGLNTVTLTAIDNNGNFATCTATVTVQDTVAPLAVCQDITVQLDASGNASIIAASIDNGSSDACGVTSIAIDQNSFTCAEVGANTVTLTVTDVNGNSSTCTSTVTVQDTVAPVAVCQDITIQLDASGNAMIAASDVDGGSSDACGVNLAVSPSTFDCSNVGANSVTLTVTDDNGNISTCTATVTVIDSIAPTAICQDITVQLDASGNATIVASDVDGGSNDACGIANLSVMPTSFTCANVGANTVTLTVTDNNGNSSTCTANVTVSDTVAPMAVCQNITVSLDASGNASIVASDLDGGSTDACGIAGLTISQSAFTCADVGTNTVTLTVTDVNGNTSECDASVIVDDNTAPNAICQDITVQLDPSGNVSITGADVDGGSNDACGIAGLSVLPASFTCANVGANTVTLTVTDVNGNTNTCSAIVTVEDTVAPVAVCQNISVQLDASGNASIVATQVDGGSSDACGIGSLAIDNSNFTCADVGTNSVTLTVTDVNGNMSTCVATVTVIDSVAPTAVCQDITVQLDASGNVSITGADVDGGSTDACGIAGLSVTPAAFTCANVGSNTVTLTVTDVNGNTATCTSTVFVEDNVAPNAICAPFTVQLDASGNGSLVASDIDGGSNDACGIASISASPTTFDCSNVGPNTVTLTVTDVNGNASTCTSTVTVEDNVTPILIGCPTDITDFVTPSNCGRIINYTAPTASDNCGIATVTQTDGTGLSSGSIFPVGTTVQEFTVTDANGNTSTCSFNITIVDNENPIITGCPSNISVTATGCGANVNWIAPIASDNCPGVILVGSHVPGSLFPAGSTVVTYTATDAVGNTSTCSFTVTVTENVPPVALCQDIIVQLDATGNASITAAEIDNGSTDNCGIGSISISTSTFTCANIGPNLVTLTVTDSNGNSATCTATVNVQDNINPIPTIPALANVTAECLVTTLTAPTATDNCAGTITGISDATLPITAQGTTLVTWTFDDGNGNTITQTQNVVINDNTAPVANVGTLADVTAECEVTSLTAPTANDNCNGTIVGVSNATLPITTQGTTVVTWTYDDGNGNTSTQTQNIVINDVTPPTPDAGILPPVTAECSVLSLTSPSATDNCGGLVSVSNDASLPITAQGTTIVTWTYMDVNGNSSTQTQDVIIDDVTAPVANNAFLADITAECSITGLVPPTALDNCSGLIVGTNNASFPITNQGTTVVTWTYDDGNGNTSTQTQNVVINDVSAPVPNLANLAPITAECSVGVLTPPTATDNCIGTIAGTSNAVLPITTQGTTTITWTFDDGNGNTSTQTQNVVINDVTAPVPAVANLAPVTAECSVTSLTPPSATDNCGGLITVTNDAVLPILTQGTTVVTWTYTDVNGNASTQTQNVVITDVTAPIPDVLVLSPATGECQVTSLTAPTATDNCGGSVSVSNDATLPITAQGTTVVTWTYTDVNGNASTQTQNVIIDDVTAPVPDAAVLVTVTAECEVTSLTPPTATDNCSGTVTVTSNATLPISAQGTTLVTWTFNDGNGNTSTQTQNVVITDVTAPVPAVATLADITAECEVTALTAPTATDNCGGTVTVTNDATLPITAQGTTIVTWTYDDGNGNTSTQTQNVVITDVTAPVPVVATLADVTAECDVASLTAPTATDNCAGTVTVTNDATLPITAQGTTVVTWTYDDGNGNTSTQTQNVVITDVTAPVPTVLTLADVTAECDVTALTAPTATDNCGGLVTVTNNASLPITTQGTTTVTWTYTDVNGNTSTQTQNVVITDVTAPVPDVANLADITADCEVTSLTAPTATDNCSGLVTVTNNAVLPITTQGTTTVTWTYDDGNGNTSTQTQNVILTDATAPVPDVANLTDVIAECEVTSLTAPTATDNCLGTVTVTNDATLPITAQGTTVVTWTYDDGNGNTTTQTQNVIITDVTAPVPDVATLADVTAECEVTSLTAPTATDNCAGTVTVTNDATLPITAQGTTVVTWTYDDGNGNTSTQTQNVVITDVTAPVADSTTLPDLEDVCEIAALTAPTATDNCSGAVTVTNDATLPITASTVITWTYTDASGNTSTQTQNVTITGLDVTTTLEVDGVTITANNAGATSYQWIDCENNQPIAGETNQVFVPTANGDYAVIVTEGSCSDTSACVSVASVGLTAVNLDYEVVLYPNPSVDGNFNVKYSGEIVSIKVVDMLGRMVDVPTDTFTGEVNGSQLSSGKYMVQIVTDQGSVLKEVSVLN